MKPFAIVTGSSDSKLLKLAVEELSKTLLEYTKSYPACFSYEEYADLSDFRCIYIGTRTEHPYIQSHANPSLCKPESYSLSVSGETVVIEGFDEAGALYGALDFYNCYIIRHEHPDDDRYWVNFFENDTLPEYSHVSVPSVAERGLWTWGHVIYDYRGYLDHLMRLKLNRVIIWNDYAPVNAADIVSYAHERNIRVYWGFPWLWDTDCAKFDFDHTDEESQKILEVYEKEYAHTGADGIYFQTFTELGVDTVRGVIIAEAAARFVNQTAALLYEKHPALDILFGLHATSVKERLEFLRAVDKRLRIVWENCGAFPFSYIPKDVADFDSTMEFVGKIAVLRGEDDRFGVVTKGLVKLDWSSFTHPLGSQCIGVSTENWKHDRIDRKSRIWRYIQAQWLAHADKAYEAVQRMCRMKDGGLCIYALVEDGMFEENILYPVALYAQMLWDTESDLETMMSDVAMRSYVHFA